MSNLAEKASKLDQKQWQTVLKGLDPTSSKKLEEQISKVEKTSGNKKNVSKTPTSKSPSSKTPTSPVDNKSKSDNPIFATDQSRRGMYRFGKGKIPYYKPTDGYPTPEEASRQVEGSLTLQHAYGYSGTTKQNLLYRNGKLIYFIAAVGIVHNLENGSQNFFTGHNDDLTTICLDPREGSKLVATGQKDPKDTPGQGKDLPKIFIWNQETCKPLFCIEKVCEQTILRIQWSPVSGILYAIAGDKSQTLIAYNLKDLSDTKKYDKKQIQEYSKTLINQPSTSDKIIGFEIKPTKSEDCVDEIVFYCSNKILVTKITEKSGKYTLGKLQAVKLSEKDKEKSFLCCKWLSNGNFMCGAFSGSVYVCKDKEVVKIHKNIHNKPVADMALVDNKTLITAGMDKCIKRFEISESGDEFKENYNSNVIKIQDSDFVMLPKAIQYNNGLIYAGTNSNQIISFNLESNEANLIIDGHDGQIHALCCHPSEDIFVTGGWDRAIKCWDPKTFRCTKTYEFPKMDSEDSKESNMHKDDWKMNTASFSPDGKWIVVGTEMSGLALLSFEPLKPHFTYQIPKANKNQKELENIAYIRFSPCGKHLAVAHMDANLYIFDVIEKEGIGSLVPWKKSFKHRAAPSHLQWSEDSNWVKCLTRDYEITHWELDLKSKSGTQQVKIPDPDKLIWGGDPLVAGWDVQGLYQEDWDGTDLNDCTLTKDKKLIFTGDDYGTIRVHNYPSIDPKAHKAYTGHAEFVQGVELLQSDSHLITCGGADMAIFQWIVNKN